MEHRKKIDAGGHRMATAFIRQLSVAGLDADQVLASAAEALSNAILILAKDGSELDMLNHIVKDMTRHVAENVGTKGEMCAKHEAFLKNVPADVVTGLQDHFREKFDDDYADLKRDVENGAIPTIEIPPGLASAEAAAFIRAQVSKLVAEGKVSKFALHGVFTPDDGQSVTDFMNGLINELENLEERKTHH